MGKWKGADFDKTCGDCIHADICERNPSLEFSRENIAWCDSFKDKTDVVEVVRCGDCIFSQELDRERPPYKYYNTNCVLCVCEDVVGDEAMIYLKNHFCSYGKRKDGAE